MLSPLAIGLGVGKWGRQDGNQQSKDQEAGSSGSSRGPTPTSKGKETAPANSRPTNQPPDASSKSWLPSPSAKTLYGLGAVALGAAAMGTAYYRREDFLNGWKWGYEHMTFVRNLWDDGGMKERLLEVDELTRTRNIRFWKWVIMHPGLRIAYADDDDTAFTLIFHHVDRIISQPGRSVSFHRRLIPCIPISSLLPMPLPKTRYQLIWACLIQGQMTGFMIWDWRW